MTKAQLMNMVMDQLLEAHDGSPESFEFLDPLGLTVNSLLWKPKTNSKVNPTGPPLINPMDVERSVIVTYNGGSHTLTCYIGKNMINTANPEVTLEVKKWWLFASSEYGKFKKLIRKMKKYNGDKENMKFIEKLMNVFPGTLDGHLFGPRDD